MILNISVIEQSYIFSSSTWVMIFALPVYRSSYSKAVVLKISYGAELCLQTWSTQCTRSTPTAVFWQIQKAVLVVGLHWVWEYVSEYWDYTSIFPGQNNMISEWILKYIHHQRRLSVDKQFQNIKDIASQCGKNFGMRNRGVADKLTRKISFHVLCHVKLINQIIAGSGESGRIGFSLPSVEMFLR